MTLTMFKAKIHRAVVTNADLNYTGSLTLDPDLLDAAGMFPYEQVHVLNVNTGARFVTYIIEGERGSGVVCLNGAAARLGAPGDTIIAITYVEMSPEEAKNHQPVVVLVDKNNKIVEVSRGAHPGPYQD